MTVTLLGQIAKMLTEKAKVQEQPIFKILCKFEYNQILETDHRN
jgi:hypothetical protein